MKLLQQVLILDTIYKNISGVITEIKENNDIIATIPYNNTYIRIKLNDKDYQIVGPN